MKEILDWLKDQYHPLSILVYGSYENGTWDRESDFDCMLIVPEKPCRHDASVVCGVQLDCFLYTPEETRELDVDTFLAAYRARVVLDEDGTGKALRRRVKAHVDQWRADEQEKEFTRTWLLKMLQRRRRGDAEGLYRGIWMLEESLPAYFLLRDRFFFGCKWAIHQIKVDDPEGYRLLHEALLHPNWQVAEAWIRYVLREEKNLKNDMP